MSFDDNHLLYNTATDCHWENVQ